MEQVKLSCKEFLTLLLVDKQFCPTRATVIRITWDDGAGPNMEILDYIYIFFGLKECEK